MSYFPIYVGAPVKLGSASCVLFSDASQNVGTDTNFKWNNVTHRMGVGVAPNVATMAVLQDPASGFLFEWVAGVLGSNTWTITEMQPSNTGSPFIFNTAGTTAGIKIIQNNNPIGAGFNELWLEGNIASRTAEQLKIVLGPTPGANADALAVFLNGGVTKVARIKSTGLMSCTPSVAGSEAFGNNAVSNNTASCAFGDTAVSSGSFSSAFGAASTASALAAGAFGTAANATATSAQALGIAAQATADSAIAIGRLAAAAHADAICIGHLASSSAIGQFVVGSETHPVTDYYFGEGVTSPTPSASTLQGTGAGAVNTAGANFTVAGGKGTGSAGGGALIMATSRAGAGGGPLNALTEAGRVDAVQNFLWGVTSAGATAEKNMVLSNTSVEATTSVDRAHLYCKDIAANRATLGVFTEEPVNAEVIGASTHTLQVFLNGTVYKVLLST